MFRIYKGYPAAGPPGQEAPGRPTGPVRRAPAGRAGPGGLVAVYRIPFYSCMYVIFVMYLVTLNYPLIHRPH